MAQQLGNLPLMSIVKIKENGVPQEFYVVRHNAYDTNRTLLLRRYVHSDRKWNTSDVNAYAGCTLDAWLNNEYFNTLPVDIRGQIAAVSIPYTPGNGSTGLSSLSRKVFAVSATELGQSHQYMNAEGIALANVAELNIAKDSAGTAKAQWTRSPYTNDTKYAWFLGTDNYRHYSSCSGVYSARPAFTLPPTTYVDDSGNVFTNSPPTAPSSCNTPDGIQGGSNITITWPAAWDGEGNLAGYKLERSVNSGGWAQVYQGGGLAHTDNIVYGWATVQYRVKAYDTMGAESGYTTGPQRGITNNYAPGPPGGVNTPDGIRGGGTAYISWGAASDSDNNLAGYRLERSVNGGGWSRIFEGNALGYTDTITYGWLTVAYRVRAYDTYGWESGVTTGVTRTVQNNRPPVISDSDRALGTFVHTPPAVAYTVTDADGDTVTVTEKLDGTVLRSYTATLGQAVNLTFTHEQWLTTPNGNHTLQVIAADGRDTATRTFTFTKAEGQISFTLPAPEPTDAKVSRFIITPSWQITGATAKVEVCNNAFDATPTWEDMTAQVLIGRVFNLTNTAKTAEKWGINIRITITKEAGFAGKVSITGFGGAYE